MDTESLISKYYKPGSLAYRVIVIHSQAIAKKALEVATRLNLPNQSLEFIREATMLHDIGIFYTHAPDIGCFGDLPYICHGFKGHDLLVAEGLPRHALVCERHTGTGLTLEDVSGFNGLLPLRPMEPVTLEEEIITYCDKFFSKDPENLDAERPFDLALEGISKFGEEKANIFKEWHHRFNP